MPHCLDPSCAFCCDCDWSAARGSTRCIFPECLFCCFLLLLLSLERDPESDWSRHGDVNRARDVSWSSSISGKRLLECSSAPRLVAHVARAKWGYTTRRLHSRIGKVANSFGNGRYHVNCPSKTTCRDVQSEHTIAIHGTRALQIATDIESYRPASLQCISALSTTVATFSHVPHLHRISGVSQNAQVTGSEQATISSSP